MNSIEFPQNTEAEKLRVRMAIQSALIERAKVKGYSNNEIALDWIEANSERFSNFFDKQLSENPNLINEFDENPDDIIKSFEIMLLATEVSKTEPQEEIKKAA